MKKHPLLKIIIFERMVYRMKLYHDSETDLIVSDADIQKEYLQSANHDEYPTFSEYLVSCMYWNNGTLTPIETYISALADRIRRLWNTWEHEADEDIKALESQISAYKAMMKGATTNEKSV